MVRWLPIWPMLLLAACLRPAAPAHADVYGQDANKAWHTADQCTKDAFTKYPDYTPAANAKREIMRQECMRNHKLPDPTSDSSGAGK